MNKEFSERLKEYLDSECDDYGLEYKWEWDEDYNLCRVTVSTGNIYPLLETEVSFRYENESLMIELSEDSWYKTAEYDYTVKYFWMLIAAALFSN